MLSLVLFLVCSLPSPVGSGWPRSLRVSPDFDYSGVDLICYHCRFVLQKRFQFIPSSNSLPLILSCVFSVWFILLSAHIANCSQELSPIVFQVGSSALEVISIRAAGFDGLQSVDSH